MKIKVKILGREYEAEGKTPEEVISKIKAPVSKLGSVLIIEDEGGTRTKVLNAFITRNVFNPVGGQMMRDIAMKQFKTLLGY